MAAVEIPARDGLRLQLAAIAGNEPASSFLELRCLRPDGSPGAREFVPVRDLKRTVNIALGLADVNVYVGGAPRVRESGTAKDVERVWTLWADCDAPEAVAALRAFRPLPSIVAGTSPGRVQALWPLKQAVAPAWARRANRRIAHQLGADMAATDPARILRVIGSRNHKHEPPEPVTCRRCELDVFTLAEIVGSLPDAAGDGPRLMRPRGTRPAPAADGLVRAVREAQVGQRNAVLFWAACTAREEGQGVREELRQAALEAGLTEHETERTLDSAERRAVA
jgi:hypothetical protein